MPSNAVKVYGIDRSYAVTTVGHIGARSHRHIRLQRRAHAGHQRMRADSDTDADFERLRCVASIINADSRRSRMPSVATCIDRPVRNDSLSECAVRRTPDAGPHAPSPIDQPFARDSAEPNRSPHPRGGGLSRIERGCTDVAGARIGRCETVRDRTVGKWRVTDLCTYAIDNCNCNIGCLHVGEQRHSACS